MSAPLIIGVVAAALGIFYVAGGGIEKAKEFLKSTESTDKKPAVEGGSQPARSDLSLDQMPLTNKERQTSEIINKINTGDQELFAKPDNLPRSDSDLSKYDNFGTQTINAQQASATLAKEQQKSAQTQRELAIPNELKYSTSLAGSVPTTGVQLKREEEVVITNAKSQGGSSALQQKIILEQERAAQLSLALYGNVQNPNFVKTPVKTVPTNTVVTKASTTAANSALQDALNRGATSATAKQLLAEAQARKK